MTSNLHFTLHMHTQMYKRAPSHLSTHRDRHRIYLGHTHSQTLKSPTKLAEIILSEEIPVGKIVHARYRSIQDAETGGSCCKGQHRLLY